MNDTDQHGDAESYAERVARHVPALTDLHRMTGLLLAEHVPQTGSVLVLGAGGGLELCALAGQHPQWRFCGIDPSAQMLAQARQTAAAHLDRVSLCQGYIDDAPSGPFDGAVCLLTLHFLERDERLRTLQQIAGRLRPGAPLVTAHHSFPTDGSARDLWLGRNAAWLEASGVPAAQARRGAQAMKQHLPVLAPDLDEALLNKAGFEQVQMFFAAFTYKGWVSRRT
ncbi:class I SAM-dependent methyltransferase [Paracoccus sp. Z330]|uniref:Class I SAM-dependent methyltransferase n=1 Tax=Paracoccus onchidii TaxID=3017813 RepID=A0ABT4ZAF2_9RHOB|nr:class I SAM-dependent methyltransferase [Paracoccus onchidii]MDB6176338.1 class I SAM-dependent methyltransferase [Paracoccus onchidii]